MGSDVFFSLDSYMNWCIYASHMSDMGLNTGVSMRYIYASIHIWINSYMNQFIYESIYIWINSYEWIDEIHICINSWIDAYMYLINSFIWIDSYINWFIYELIHIWIDSYMNWCIYVSHRDACIKPHVGHMRCIYASIHIWIQWEENIRPHVRDIIYIYSSILSEPYKLFWLMHADVIPRKCAGAGSPSIGIFKCLNWNPYMWNPEMC